MVSWNAQIRQKALLLRSRGFTYNEVRDNLGESLPSSTLSYWFRDVVLPSAYYEKIRRLSLENIAKARARALQLRRIAQARYFRSIFRRHRPLVSVLQNLHTAKIALAVLYAAEGSRNIRRAALSFGNSDPMLVRLFLHLLRKCYSIDERKFRCTVQCRADQDTRFLERYWSHVTSIPHRQFYPPHIDPRTIGKPSRKLDYKGVCRIEYFSASILHDLIYIIPVLHKGL